MKEPRKEHHQSSRLPSNHPEDGRTESTYIPGIRKCRSKIKNKLPGLEMQRAQLAIQLEAIERELAQLEKQRDTLIALYEEVFSLGHRAESHNYLSKIFELEREEGRLVQRLSLLEELAEEVDQKLSES